jgi:hypothetical protein
MVFFLQIREKKPNEEFLELKFEKTTRLIRNR